jgi:hypothetical protein
VSVRRIAGVARAAFAKVHYRVAALAVAVVMVGGIGASNASAFDEVWLNNASNVPFTQESYCILVGAVTCPQEDNSAWVRGAVLAAGKQNPGIFAILQVVPEFLDPTLTTTWYPSGSGNYFTFYAEDPAIGPVIVQCYGNVPGFSCGVVGGLYAYISQTGSASATGPAPVLARFWSGVAPVTRGGIALVPVASYSLRRHGAARERVVLSGPKGVIATGEKTVRFGTRTEIEVRLPSGIVRALARVESVDVRASVKHADGTVGTGQTTRRLLLTTLTPALKRVLHLPPG